MKEGSNPAGKMQEIQAIGEWKMKEGEGKD